MPWPAIPRPKLKQWTNPRSRLRPLCRILLSRSRSQPAKQIVPQPAQPSGQYDGLETLLQQILQGQQSTTQAMQTMTQTMQANALGLGIQQQPAADASTVTARIIDPTYGQEVK